MRTVGIKTRADLEEVGPIGAFERIRDAGLSSSLNLLYALSGALMDVHWAELPPDLKHKLRAAVTSPEPGTEERSTSSEDAGSLAARKSG